MLAGLRSLFEEQQPIVQQEPFGLARLFYHQNEQFLRKKKKRQQEEEELLAIMGIEL